ncbi:unnamed protein product [Staurois parvus]|uniref:Uncharacterized protein n=1 Tax=Staurois parvus TaxID=386267 RepID=A0ABN9CVQ9_9NEOB|nr:unnamed protein product [Staurois parvus]
MQPVCSRGSCCSMSPPPPPPIHCLWTINQTMSCFSQTVHLCTAERTLFIPCNMSAVSGHLQ